MNAESSQAGPPLPANMPASPPTIDAIHRDIGFANAYRLELLKQLMTISAALFAFTITFRPSLAIVQAAWSMWIGWGALCVSMVGGMVHMLGWDHFYKSYRDYKGDIAAGDLARDRINLWRRPAMGCQFFGFAIGVAGVGYFAAANIDGTYRAPAPVAPPPVTAPAPTAGAGK